MLRFVLTANHSLLKKCASLKMIMEFGSHKVIINIVSKKLVPFCKFYTVRDWRRDLAKQKKKNGFKTKVLKKKMRFCS